MTTQRDARRIRHLVACVVALLVVALLPASAWAHAHLHGSAPSAGARLTVAPTQIRLTFSEPPTVALSSVRLTGPGGADVPVGALVAAPEARDVVVATIRVALTAGPYTVTWQVVGDDGHPTHGQFAFTVLSGAQGAAAGASPVRTPPSATPQASRHGAVDAPPHEARFGVESPLYAAVRWLQYVGLLVALGAVTFRYAVLGALTRTRSPSDAWLPALREGAARFGFGASLVVGLAAALRLLAQAYTLQGTGAVRGGGLLGAMLLHTVWGAGWLVQVPGVVIAALGFAQARRSGTGGWGVAALGTAALAVSPGLSGHAASAPQWTALVVVADVAHVVGAGGWLGSLLVVVAIGVPAVFRIDAGERGPAVAALIEAFSPTALLFAGIVAATGVFATWVHVGTIPALWQTAYGRTLLVKLALLAIVAAAGAYNWLRVRPSLGTGTAASVVRLRRSTAVELFVGLLVLAATAVLVATPTAVDVRGAGVPAPGPVTNAAPRL